eukprot:345029-Rhodomonas_salina.2
MIITSLVRASEAEPSAESLRLNPLRLSATLSESESLCAESPTAANTMIPGPKSPARAAAVRPGPRPGFISAPFCYVFLLSPGPAVTRAGFCLLVGQRRFWRHGYGRLFQSQISIS